MKEFGGVKGILKIVDSIKYVSMTNKILLQKKKQLSQKQ